MSNSATPAGHTKEFTVLMALLMSIGAISIDALLPALSQAAQDLHLSNPNHAQYLIGFIFVGMAFGQLVAGPLSDALGRKKVLYGGIAIYLLGTVLAYSAQTLPIMLIGRVIQGLGVAGPYISAISIVRDKYSGREMARLMSLVMMIFITVPAIAPSLGQAIMLGFDWRAIYILYFIYALVIVIWIFFRLEETLPKEKRSQLHFPNVMQAFKEVLTHPVTFSYMICMGLCFGAFFGYLISCQQIFQDQFGVGESFSLYFGALAIVMGGSSFVNSRYVKRLGMHYISVRSFSVIIVVSAIFLAMHIVVPITLPLFMVFAAVTLFCFGLIFGNMNALAMEPMGHIAGSAAALIGFITNLMSMSLGSFIGQLYNGTLVPIVAGFIVLSAISMCILYYADGKRRQMGLKL